MTLFVRVRETKDDIKTDGMKKEREKARKKEREKDVRDGKKEWKRQTKRERNKEKKEEKVTLCHNKKIYRMYMYLIMKIAGHLIPFLFNCLYVETILNGFK